MMKERFAESEFLAGVPEKLGGAICMQVCTAVNRRHWVAMFLMFNFFSMIRNHARESFSGPTPLPQWV